MYSTFTKKMSVKKCRNQDDGETSVEIAFTLFWFLENNVTKPPFSAAQNKPEVILPL